jgi:hypothetical protein
MFRSRSRIYVDVVTKLQLLPYQARRVLKAKRVQRLLGPTAVQFG